MEKLELLKKLLNQNSFTRNKAGVDKVGLIVQKELPFMNKKVFSSKRFGDLILFRSKIFTNESKKVLLAGHSDTVHRPGLRFPTVQKGNKLYGPGTNDMKGGLLVIIEVLKNLYSENKLRNISFILIPDEEMGSNAHKKKLEYIYKEHDIGLVYEASGCPNTKLHNFTPLKRSVVTARKGFGGAVFTISAPGGHSGVLTKRNERISAIQEAAHKILEIEKLADYQKETTTNCGVIKGGTVLNSIASSAEITADYRISTEEERTRVRREYEKIAQKDFIRGTSTKLKWLYDILPMTPTAQTNKLLMIAKEIGKNLHIEVNEEKRGGASDANHLSQYNMIVLDGMGCQGDNDHTAKEFLYINSIQKSIDFSRKFIEKLISEFPSQ
ncbi:M20/M25/M40 family metallo-hydrolase [Candidatus Dojkabacteria bacterium]|nr:M20/M25/M40 family metallo-hydrolase [Candidatus Dojkabacteria bacterium]